MFMLMCTHHLREISRLHSSKVKENILRRYGLIDMTLKFKAVVFQFLAQQVNKPTYLFLKCNLKYVVVYKMLINLIFRVAIHDKTFLK